MADSQFCDGDNFIPLPKIEEVTGDDLVPLPSAAVPFTEWIFPNSLRFQCSGTITGWIFRAEMNQSVNLSTIDRLPQWSIYRDNPLTSTELDFFVVRRTGNRDELNPMQSGLYNYSLSSPVDVLAGDILGIGYSDLPRDSRQLQISFLDVERDGRETPTSYRRIFTASFLLFAELGDEDNRYTPLVTPIMGKINFQFTC